MPDAPGLELILAGINRDHPGAVLDTSFDRDQPALIVDAAHILAVLAWLRDTEDQGYTFLASVHGADYLPAEPRFAVHYELINRERYERLRVKALLADPAAKTNGDGRPEDPTTAFVPPAFEADKYEEAAVGETDVESTSSGGTAPTGADSTSVSKSPGAASAALAGATKDGSQAKPGPTPEGAGSTATQAGAMQDGGQAAPGSAPEGAVPPEDVDPGAAANHKPDGASDRLPHIDTVTSLFPTAEFQEREVYDFFGIVFDGHPDLRRILMPEDYVGWPQRRDFPIGGEPVIFTRDEVANPGWWK